MKQDLISIIIPVYKVEKYLNKCVESLIGQTYKNLEIFLVDDGSPDNCPKMCDEWAEKDNRIKVIHKENGGQGSARNLALDKCNGEYICFVDSDDWVDPNYVENLYNAIIENNADISICGINSFYEKNNMRKPLIQSKETLIYEKPYLIHKAYHSELFCEGPCNKLYKNIIFSNLRFPEIKAFEDSAVYLDIMDKAKKIVIIPDLLYNYLIRNSSTMRSPLTPIRSNCMFIQNNLRLQFLEKNNLNNLLFLEIVRCLNNCYGQFRRTKDKNLRKKIKEQYLNYRKKYKHIINFWSAPLRLKIKMLLFKLH